MCTSKSAGGFVQLRRRPAEHAGEAQALLVMLQLYINSKCTEGEGWMYGWPQGMVCVVDVAGTEVLRKELVGLT